MRKGTRVLLVVVLATALVLTPLILAGVFLGFYLGDQVGISKSILAIAFSTAGFVAGMAILFKVIGALAGRAAAPKG